MSATLEQDFPPITPAAIVIPENMALWKAAFVTDPAAVKPITGKQYRGNSPKPYWIIQRATEIFGACGIGWGLEVLNERFERLTDTDVLHVALIRVWYIYDGEHGTVEQMGQTKACYKTKGGGMMVDEDAPKKSVTDGMVKCLSMLGFAGDVFSGRWDDSKYIAIAAAETKRRVEAENPPPIIDDNTPDDEWFISLASEVADYYNAGDIEGAYRHIRNSLVDKDGKFINEWLEVLWKHVDSKPRSGIKACSTILHAKTVEAVDQAWEATPKHSQTALTALKERRKQELQPMEVAA